MCPNVERRLPRTSPRPEKCSDLSQYLQSGGNFLRISRVCLSSATEWEAGMRRSVLDPLVLSDDAQESSSSVGPDVRRVPKRWRSAAASCWRSRSRKQQSCGRMTRCCSLEHEQMGSVSWRSASRGFTTSPTPVSRVRSVTTTSRWSSSRLSKEYRSMPHTGPRGRLATRRAWVSWPCRGSGGPLGSNLT
jgi:hypothetical protein